MKPLTFLTATLAILPGVLAVDVTKSVIVRFEKDNTPSHIIDQAKKAITDAGGKITHVYDLIQYAPPLDYPAKLSFLTVPGASPHSHPKNRSRMSKYRATSGRSMSRRTRSSRRARSFRGVDNEKVTISSIGRDWVLKMAADLVVIGIRR
jgi:hypothetical protein